MTLLLADCCRARARHEIYYGIYREEIDEWTGLSVEQAVEARGARVAGRAAVKR